MDQHLSAETSPRRRRSVGAFLLACIVGLGSLSAQQTLVVGPGQAFTTIQPAIAAAAPGDTVLVLAGTYAGTLDIDKGIRLVGRGASLSFALSIFSGIPAIAVHDVPIDQTVSILGFELASVTGSSFAPVQVTDCPGPVAVRGLQANNGQLWYVGATRSTQVHLADSFLYGFGMLDSQVVAESCLCEPAQLWSVRVTTSTLVLVDCTLPGANGPLGGPGVQLEGGTLLATRCTISGSAGQPAIQTTAGSMLLDPNTILQPGVGAPAITGPVTPVFAALGSNTTATDGSQVTIRSQGPAGGDFAVLLSFTAQESVTPIGLSWLDPASTMVLYFGTYDPIDGSQTTTLPHPTLPPGMVFTLQPIYLVPSGLALGVPSLLTTP